MKNATLKIVTLCLLGMFTAPLCYPAIVSAEDIESSDITALKAQESPDATETQIAQDNADLNGELQKEGPQAQSASNRGDVIRGLLTIACPGNRARFGVPKGSLATERARRRVFGAPGTNLSTYSFMGKQVTTNSKIKPCLKAVEADLKYKYKTRYKLHVIGGYSDSPGNNPRLFHAYGGAVDINPAQNPMCNGGCGHNIPSSWVRAFRAHGFYWGGNYKNTKDYMHFEWHGQR